MGQQEQIRQRLEFIERQLYWFGTITKSMIRTEFLISEHTAETDIKRYKEREGDLVFNGRRYVAKPHFKPCPTEPDAEDLLYELARSRGLAAPGGGFANVGVQNPPGDDTPAPSVHNAPHEIPIYAPPELPRRSIDPECLRQILWAITKNGEGSRKNKLVLEIEIIYKSPHDDEERTFWIAPHALNHDTFRWACRAFRYDFRRFGDIVLDRVVDFRGEREREGDVASEDLEWNTLVELELGPNPDLPEDAQQHIRDQYFMQGLSLKIPVRQAFIVYFLKRYQIEEKSTRKAPHQEPLVLLNREEITRLIPPRMRVPPEPEPQ